MQFLNSYTIEDQILGFIDRAKFIGGMTIPGSLEFKASASDSFRESLEKRTKEWLEAYKDDPEKLLKLGQPLPPQENKSEKGE